MDMGWDAPWFPAQPARVSAWIASEARRIAAQQGGLSEKSLLRRVSALNSHHADIGVPLIDAGDARLKRIITGANRWHGLTKRAQPLPITLPILRRLVSVIRKNPQAYGGPTDSLGLAAAYLVCFAGFFRAGDIVTNKFDPATDLRVEDFSSHPAQPDRAIVHLRKSKNDQAGKGVDVVIATGPAEVCAIRAVIDYHNARQPAIRTTDAMFVFGGKALSKAVFVSYLRRALSDAGYVGHDFSGHSFRRGAATWAASIGMPATQIQTLGRWSSDAFRLYIDAGPTEMANASARLLNADAADSSLPASGIPLPGQVWRAAIA